MCGIIVSFTYRDDGSRIERESFLRARDQMRSRGPDASGEWFSDDGRIALAHTRLSILDLSDAASQPMWTNDHRIGIVYNGEIYNYREIRVRLETRGIRFSTTSDTEVLLQLYLEAGERMYDQLRGMFAFAILDLRDRSLLLARDPFGIKPLYYADDGATILVASQVKALVASGVSATVDSAGAAGFFLLGSVPEPWTIHDHIRSVPAGSSFRVSSNGMNEPMQHFSIAHLYREAQERSPTGQIVASVRDSIRAHLVSDVPVGAFLSAGVDSSAIAGAASSLTGGTLEAITLEFEEYLGTKNDEAPLAREIASRYGVRHHVRRLGYEEFAVDLPRILAAMDQPSIDGINTWFVSKAAAELGWKVALSGLGGDELFGGYPSFRDVPRLVRTMAVPSRIPIVRRIVRKLLAASAAAERKPKLSGIAEYGGTWHGAWFLRRALFLPWELESLLGTELAEAGLLKLNLLEQIERVISPDPGNAFGRIATMESALYMQNQLLRDTDWASMAHSLEVRVPLVDRVLLESVASDLMRRRPGKQVLAGVPDPPLPELVLRRAKTGFTIPIFRWLDRLEGRDPEAGPLEWGLAMRRWARRVFEEW